MTPEDRLEELQARLQLAQGSATLLFAIVESDAALEETRRAFRSLLTSTPLDVADLGACELHTGPGRWAELTRSRTAEVYLLSAAPQAPFGVTAFAALLNAEREFLRQLAGPLVMVISRATEQALRHRAPDFVTWAAQAYELPRAETLSALTPRNDEDPGPATGASRAPAETPIRFLHISDFHLRPQRVKRYDQDRVLRGLLQLLEADREGFPLDLVFVTGDLGHGGKAEEYALATDFLRTLMAVSEVPPARIFVVPGNHDVDREVGRWLLRSLSSDEEAIRFFEEEESRRFHAQKLEGYRKSLTSLLGPDRALGLGVGADAVEIVDIRGARLAVASFNSAWFAQADDDQGRLWLGEANVAGAEGRIADEGADFAIALMHHPFDDLHEIERWMVERRCERVFDLVLRGHLHQERTRSIVSQRGGFVEVAAPAAYQGSQWANGCFFGEIRPRARSVTLRPYAYSGGADPWVLDTKTFPDSRADGYCHTFRVPEKKRLRTAMGKSLWRAAEATVLATPPAMREALAAQLDILPPPGAPVASAAQVTKGVHETLLQATAQSLLHDRRGPQEGPGMILRSDPRFLEKALLLAARRARSAVATSGLGRTVTGHTLEHLFCSALEAVVEGPVSVLSMSQSDDPDVLIGSEKDAPHQRAVIELRLEVRGDVVKSSLTQLERHLTAFPAAHAAVVLSDLAATENTAPSVERIESPTGREVLLLRM
ncbi:metallophosphoesterase family protein [Chondromyces crocatus]|uniref:Calcineurin-like phosphoesterase domain-containing protein n=1 Tax=Chondromyces crocatus TaxID=52 RepID=A0A0K1EMQ1_CHOCO|nr:metallophosphoesterase [Chondromyces crocatus]AKT41923.1 uncharacterized protein CMC5_061450 [Chondromyces crocatus]